MPKPIRYSVSRPVVVGRTFVMPRVPILLLPHLSVGTFQNSWNSEEGGWKRLPVKVLAGNSITDLPVMNDCLLAIDWEGP